MPLSGFRLVLDTNVVVRAFINLQSDSGRIFKACEHRRMVPLLSGPVLGEYRRILGDRQLLSRFPQLDRPEITVALERLLDVSDTYRRIRTRFPLPRDPEDSHLIEWAIAGGATHLISTDDDLLVLPHGSDDAAKRFRQRLPHVEVAKPADFIGWHGARLTGNQAMER